MNVATMTRHQIVERARSMEGTPWHHQGRLPGVGVDCIGLLVLAGEVGHDSLDYGLQPKDGTLRREMILGGFEPIAMKDAKPGDAVTFDMGMGGESHVAIFSAHPAGGLGLIHTLNAGAAEARCVRETSFSGQWPSRVVSAWRFPGARD